ncbi:MAG: phosphatidate cytidylyltransferase [Candidatus Latescibacterota bacterium]|nr:phosphatidate cytidylyltransferase [Candidatus Latescibacterota bacterium]
MTEGSNGQLTPRVLSACVFVPIVLGLTWYGGWGLLALVCAIVGRSTWELLHMVEDRGHRPLKWIAVGLSLLWCLWVQILGSDSLLTPALIVVVLVLGLALLRGVDGYLGNSLFTLGAVLFVGLLGSTPLVLSQQPDGSAQILVTVLLSIWLTDAAAYGGGRLWGRRKLVPEISPNKTGAGFISGLVGGLVPALGHSYVAFWSLPQLLGLLLVVSIAGQVGDIVESAIKRDLGVKDAPALIPGHGGMIDRFDSYLFAFPAALIYFQLLACPEKP